MMSIGQKAIAFGALLFINLLVFLFMGVFVVFTLIPSAMIGLLILQR